MQKSCAILETFEFYEGGYEEIESKVLILRHRAATRDG